ncbi:hypothetical protein [Candidatus Methanarcanum hacksteinii]|uniref:hypothetical protein n=1 Tax=Candidatus Methanarcanum hacksteinii TaxID=2911857 RepID=UPI0037DC7F2B
MKSTMKSAFAFIAVALMIMVAVVPMVGVFTEDSSATTTVDPATDKNKIELEVTVADGLATGDKVKIAYGSYVFYEKVDTSKKAKFTIYEASVAELTISCVDEDDVKIEKYSEVKLTNLVDKRTYSATLKAGYDSQEVKFEFKNAGSIGDLLQAEDSTTTAKYSIYDKEAEDATAIYYGSITIGKDSKGTILYPAGTSTSNIYIKVESFDSLSKITFAKQKVTVPSSVASLKAEESVVSVKPSIDLCGEVIVESLSVAYKVGEGGTSKEVTTSFEPIKNKMVDSTTTYAEFYGILPPSTGATEIKYKANLFANDVRKEAELSAASTNLTYTPSNAFFGTIKMGTYIQEGTIGATIVVSNTDKITVSDVKVDAKGNFFSFVDFSDKTGTKMTDISFTSGETTFKIADMTSSTIAGKAALTFTIPGAGYSEVSGTFGYMVGTTTTPIADKKLTITGAKTFGSLVTTNTGFKFMAETGKNIIVSAEGSELYGDISIVPGSSSTSKKIYMSTQDITLKVADALEKVIGDATVKLMDGAKVIATLTYDTPTKVYKATIRGDLTPADYTVTITKDKHTFAKAPAFVEGSTYKAEEATYTLTFCDKDGEKLASQPTSGADYEIFVAKAYKNTLNSIVYTYVDADKVTVTGGKLIVKASVLGVKESDISTELKDALILSKKGAGLDDKGIFKDKYYLLDADDKGVISITASVDSFTGKLVRNDGVTPVSGIEVKLMNGTTFVDISYTQKDGSFTLYSNLEIKTGYKVEFIDAYDYTFTSGGYNVFKSADVKNTVFKAATSAYKITFVDADDAKIETIGTPTIGTVTVDTSKVTGNVAKLTAGWTSETGALAISDVTDRSFIDHTLTAEELASGEITVKSNQKTYTFTVKDANGAKLPGVGIAVKKYVGDIAINSTATVSSLGEVILPVATDEIDTVYGYVATKTNYEFETAVTKITDVKIDIKSTSAMKTVTLQDAAGVALTKDVNGGVTIKEDGVAPLTADIVKGSFKFVATKDVVYTYTFTDALAPYTFAEDVKDVNGVVKAKQETITGKVTDAAGKYFDIDVAVRAYDANGPITSATGTQYADNTSFSIIAEKSKIAYYKASVTGDKFTFKDSKTADIKAVETFVPITFASANDISIEGVYSFTEVNVVNKLGIQSEESIVEVNKTKGIVLDTTDVVSYSVTFASATTDGYFAKATYTSVNGAFVSDVAEYKGKLGATYATGDVLEYAVYKGNELVLRDNIVVGADKTVYSAKVNKALGDKVIITFKKGADVYTAVMNDNVVYNDLVKVVVAPSLHANIMVNNDYVGYELSADKTKVYLIANESYSVGVTSSTGEKLVEKFVFDGWYVNGEKVSSKLNYTVDNVDSNVVMANYVSDGYYEIDKPVQNDNGVSPTVLAIGIAAVIVALIAVVYTVIQKRE